MNKKYYWIVGIVILILSFVIFKSLFIILLLFFGLMILDYLITVEVPSKIIDSIVPEEKKDWFNIFLSAFAIIVFFVLAIKDYPNLELKRILVFIIFSIILLYIDYTILKKKRKNKH